MALYGAKCAHDVFKSQQNSMLSVGWKAENVACLAGQSFGSWKYTSHHL